MGDTLSSSTSTEKQTIKNNLEKDDHSVLMIDDWTKIVEGSSPILGKLDTMCTRLEKDLDRERAELTCKLDEILRQLQLMKMTLKDTKHDRETNAKNKQEEEEENKKRNNFTEASVQTEPQEIVSETTLAILLQKDQEIYQLKEHLETERKRHETSVQDYKTKLDALQLELNQVTKDSKSAHKTFAFNKGLPWFPPFAMNTNVTTDPNISHVRELNSNLRKKKVCPFVPLKSESKNIVS